MRRACVLVRLCDLWVVKNLSVQAFMCAVSFVS